MVVNDYETATFCTSFKLIAHLYVHCKLPNGLIFLIAPRRVSHVIKFPSYDTIKGTIP